MRIIAYLVGFGLMGYSTYVNLYPQSAAAGLKRLYRDVPLRYVAILPAAVAVLFILAAPAATCPWLLWLFGVLSAVEAVLALTNPNDVYRQMVNWFFAHTGDGAYRVFGILGVIFGTLILTMIK